MSTSVVHTYEYVSGYDNQTVEFNVSNILIESSKPIRSRSWAYSIGIRDIANARLKAREVDIEVSFVPKTGSENGMKDADMFRRICDRDIYMRTPGMMVVDGKWMQRCYVVGHKSEEHQANAHKGTDTFVFLDGYWWNRVIGRMGSAGSNITNPGIVGGFDYPHDYPYDYAYSESGGGSNSITVNTFLPADIFIQVEGPASGPISLSVAGNTYKVDTSLAIGERLTVDGREKLIYITSDNINRSVFEKGVRGSGKGSGNYIFEPIKPGTYDIEYSGMSNFYIGWYEMDTEPPWSR